MQSLKALRGDKYWGMGAAKALPTMLYGACGVASRPFLCVSSFSNLEDDAGDVAV